MGTFIKKILNQIISRMKKLFTLACAMVFLTSAQVFAQRTVTGVISDSDGEALIGANVLEKGTLNGTISDIDGSYSLTVADGATLVFSFTGFADQEIVVGNQSTINVSLAAGQLLDEVVVTGYGTQKSREVTSSITSIKAEDFNRGNVNDVTQLLQGKVPGLAVSRPGNNPNGGFSVRLRGLSTVGASTEPLIVIDGVLGGDLNSIEPQDIASIDVLRDGSAAAIYGTRGASGVILVTTKRGVAGSSKVEYTGQVSADVVDRVPDVLTADEYRAFGGGNDLGGSIDWFDELTRTGISQTHNLSLSGGTAQTSYRLSGNFRNINGIAETTGFDRFNLRGNVTQKALNDKLTVSANISTSTNDASLGFDEAFRYATIFNPTVPAARDLNNPSFARWDGYAQQVLFDYYNPLAIIEQNTRDRKVKALSANIRGDYKITDDLSVGMFYSSQRSNTDFAEHWSKFSFLVGENAGGRATRRNDEAQDQLFRIEANYKKTLAGNTDLTLLGGYEYQDFSFQGFGATGGRFISDAFTYNNLGAASDFPNGLGSVFSYRNTNKLISFFGRANLNFDDKFFVSGSLRRDGSSRFGAGKQWGLFPALSAGVDLAKVAGLEQFNQLKLRAGYGVTGNNVGSSYQSLQRFGPTGNFFFNGAFVPSYGPISNPNPELKWETTNDLNIGVDFAVMDYKLTGSLEYYTKETKDGIFNFNVPVPPNLFGQTLFNVGNTRNQGIDLALAYNGTLGNDKTYTLQFTASRWLTPKLVSLTDENRGVSIGGFIDGANLGSPGQNGTPLVRLQENAPLGQLWGLVIDPNNPINESGEWNFVDVDGNGVQDDIADRAVIGNGFPKYLLGLNSTFNLGQLDLNVFFRGVLGHDLINTFRAFYEAPGQISAYNILATSADIPNLKDQPQFSSRHVESADFLKLDNLTLGYTLKSSGLPSGFSKIRLFVTGQNLITITGYSGVSPEPRLSDDGSSFGPLAPGIDRRNTYFSARTFTFGVNLGL
jgi:iron complex outermembrane receptor protein